MNDAGQGQVKVMKEDTSVPVEKFKGNLMGEGRRDMDVLNFPSISGTASRGVGLGGSRRRAARFNEGGLRRIGGNAARTHSFRSSQQQLPQQRPISPPAAHHFDPSSR